MLPRAWRLRSSADFSRTYRYGRRFHGRWLVAYARSGSGSGVRFGFSVSKKVGNAVRRNRLKRWLREACWRRRELVEGSRDIIFVMRPVARQGISYRLVEQDVEKLLREIGKGDAN